MSVPTRAATTMPNELTNLSETSSRFRPVVVEKPRVERTAMGMPTASVPATRPRPSLSCTAAMMTSRMEMRDVKPASRSEPKKSAPMSAPSGAWLMIVGNAINARPMPSAATSETC